MSSLRDVSTGSLSVTATYRYTSTHIFISDTFLGNEYHFRYFFKCNRLSTLTYRIVLN